MRRFRIETGGSGTGGGFVGGGSGGDTKPVDEQPPAHDSTFPSNAKSGDTHTIKRENGSQFTYRLDCNSVGKECIWVGISAVLPEAVVKADRVTYSQFPINPINNQLVFGGDELVYIYIDKTWYGAKIDLPKNVSDETKNPCIAAILKKLVASQNNIFSDILNKTFGNKSKALLKLYFDAGLTSENALTEPQGNQKQYINIVLNPKMTAQGASQESFAATIIHEMLHAYWYYEKYHNNNKTVPQDDHEYMATNHVGTMKDMLMAMFPNLSASDAEALAWGGLEKTAAYKTQVIDKGKNNAVQTVNDRENGHGGLKPNGTPCK